MLFELHVEDLAIIDRASVRFGTGFTALTGETGAGKSLLIDALSLALGARADSDLVRSGSARAKVTLTIEIKGNHAAKRLCESLGSPADGETVTVERKVAAGKSTARINGRQVPASSLKELGFLLVDLHSQHDHQGLLDPFNQLTFLDNWIGVEAEPLVDRVQKDHEAFERLSRAHMASKTGRRERDMRIDILNHQVKEISEAGLVAGEDFELAARLERLKNLDRLRTGVALLLDATADSDSAAQPIVRAAMSSCASLALVDSSLQEAQSRLMAADIELDEAVRFLRGYLESLEFDGAGLEQVAERIDTVSRLKSKYGDTIEDVLSFLADAEVELASLTSNQYDESALVQMVDDAQQKLQDSCDSLTLLRTEKAKEFAGSVQTHLRELGMEKSVFSVEIERTHPGPKGQDLAAFKFADNPVEGEMLLHKVASGGELSRIMLAIKVASAGRAGVPTLVFDEVDTGLGGRAAAAVAAKLVALAKDYQVIVISHLPQIASKADTHFRINKTESGDRVKVECALLEGDERVQEVARMLAGMEIGSSALANARELLSI